MLLGTWSGLGATISHSVTEGLLVYLSTETYEEMPMTIKDEGRGWTEDKTRNNTTEKSKE